MRTEKAAKKPLLPHRAELRRKQRKNQTACRECNVIPCQCPDYSVTISAPVPMVSHLQSAKDEMANLLSVLPRPLHDRVLVQRIPEPEPEPGAIIAPEIARKKPLEAMVLAVGPGRQREDEWGGSYFQPTQVKAGQRVLISPGVDAGKWSDIAEEAMGGYLMIQEADVIGVLD